MADNTKYTARIPIIPDSLTNTAEHKDKEIILDFDENDIYIKRGDKYVNITGEIKDSIKEIRDGSVILHVVTEETLPPVKERQKNHWYYVITKTENYNNGSESDTTSYIYYGVINDEYYQDSSYLLIAQNMILNPKSVQLRVPEGYKACFYIPISYEPQFFDEETELPIAFSVQDRLYCFTPDNVSVAYDVYISDADNLGDVYIRIDFTGVDWYNITFSTNDNTVEGLLLPDSVKIENGAPIGNIKDPIWTENRYLFQGWSLKKAEYVPVNLSTYLPTENLTIYAYFTYDSDATKYTYKCIYTSASSGETLGTFYSVAAPGTEISAKTINGYTTPTTTVALSSDAQIIEFQYEPTSFNIIYELDGGSLDGLKATYTIEDDYTPGTPMKNGYTFERWSPRKISKGTIGDITFTATWTQNAILATSSTLRAAIMSLSDTIDSTATSIARSATEPSSSYTTIDASGNSVPIIMWYDQSVSTIKYYCTVEKINSSNDLSGLFEGFTSLRTLDGLTDYLVMDGMANISNMFKNCHALAELTPVNSWNMTGRNFNAAFSGTAAYTSGRLPDWYIFDVKITYKSSVDDSVIYEENTTVVPDKPFMVPLTISIQDYVVPTDTYRATTNGQEFTIVCTPI